MSNKQRFFSALKDTFVGQKTKGNSGFVNLLDLRQKYFKEIESYLTQRVNLGTEAEKEIYEKLYSFFDSYLNETGTVFFNKSQLHKNLYEKVYSDREDVSLFWKTHNLYYVKSDIMYDDLETEINGITYFFDANYIKHKKGNEKKKLKYYLSSADSEAKKLTFKAMQEGQTQFSRVKQYLGLENLNNDKVKDYLLEHYGEDLHANVFFVNNNLDHSVFNTKGDLRECVNIINENDLIDSVTVEFSPNKVEHILKYCANKNIDCNEDDINKAFNIYQKQNEVDYFVHKEAESFLKEQFDIYMYNWLFKDIQTKFDVNTVNRIQNIRGIAYEVIEYISRFEDELKAIWEKPKFVRNSNYVFTLDKLFPILEWNDDGTVKRDFSDGKALKLVDKIINHSGFKSQIEEWKTLTEEQYDDKGNQIKKEWKEFSKFIYLENENFDTSKIESEYWNLYIDTKHFGDLKWEILEHFNNIEELQDGVLVKSDNWQTLNSLRQKLNNEIDLIYIDPPFNTGNDFAYKDNFQDSTWLTLMENRLTLAHELLSSRGRISVHLDDNANYYARILLNDIFGKSNFIDSIIWKYGSPSGGRSTSSKLVGIHNQILNYAKKYNERLSNKLNLSYSQSYINDWFRPDENEELYRVRERNGNWEKQYLKDSPGMPASTVWDEIKQDSDEIPHLHPSINNLINVNIDIIPEVLPSSVWDDIKQVYADPRAYKDDQRHLAEIMLFDTQKPERLIKRIIDHSTKTDSTVMDFFCGTGTTVAVAHKMKLKWIGVELSDYFNEIYWDSERNIFKQGVLGRMKKVLLGNVEGISKDEDVAWQGGGFFKYYELEQYEDVLSRAVYKWQGNPNEQIGNQVEKYTFLQDQKLLDAIEIDYNNAYARIVFDNLYSDIDIAETLSNLTGKSLKKISKDYCILQGYSDEEELKIDFNDMTFEKYPWIKPLIWWNSKEAKKS